MDAVFRSGNKFAIIKGVHFIDSSGDRSGGLCVSPQDGTGTGAPHLNSQATLYRCLTHTRVSEGFQVVVLALIHDTGS